MTFHETVNEASLRGGIVAKASEACDALTLLAAPAVILNMSDGHNHAVLNIIEDDAVMTALRQYAQEQYVEAMKAVIDG